MLHKSGSNTDLSDSEKDTFYAVVTRSESRHRDQRSQICGARGRRGHGIGCYPARARSLPAEMLEGLASAAANTYVVKRRAQKNQRGRRHIGHMVGPPCGNTISLVTSKPNRW
jgi:hypothetical protein